jgi:hypothetical protein
MVKCSVLFEVRAEYLNIIQTSFGFKGLKVITDFEDFTAVNLKISS